MTSRLFRSAMPSTALAIFVLILAACGGGGSGSSSTRIEGSTGGATGSPATPLPAPVAPNLTQPPLPMPSNIASGSTVVLQCGRVYQGTLDLRGKADVTVSTGGSCGKAVLTPGQPINGWTHYRGNVYSAPMTFQAVQVAVDAQPMSLAHWPSRAQTWAKAGATTADSLQYNMPNPDLAGANLVFRYADWAIEARKISAYSGGSMSLTASDNPNVDGYALSGTPDFYVEGKLWMLDEPGEWALSNGRLYLWAPDGQSPEGRVWASPNQHGIDAADSSGVSINGVRIFGAANGVHGADARRLSVTNVEITNSSGNGITNSGGSGLTVDGSVLRNSRHDGIIVKWGGGGERIANSRIDASGDFGMPVNAHGAITLTLSDGSSIHNNQVSNSAYIGIRAYRNATITQNTVDTACKILTDCGGIYLMARDRLPLNSRIESNTVKNVGLGQRLAWALWLDDFANGVTLRDNIVSGNANGMMIHNGFNNTVSGNRFSASSQAHIQMAESSSSASVRNNTISGNSFITRNSEETYRLSSDLGSASVAQFGNYAGNDYRSSSTIFSNFNGEALSFAQWRQRTGQDATSSLTAP